MYGTVTTDNQTGRKLSFALAWSFAQSFGAQGITVVVSFLLARELGPEIFGRAALAIVFVLLLDMLLHQGISSAVIQRPNLSDRDLDTAFWLLIIIALGMIGFTFGFAGLWAELNDEPQLRELTIVLSAVLPIRAVSVVQDAILRRNLEFKALALRNLAAAVIGAVVGLGAAIAGYGIWALIWQQIAVAGGQAVLIWGTSKWRPSFRFRGSSGRDLLAYSLPISLASLGVFSSERSDTIITSFFFGRTAVGLHRFAVRFVDVLTSITSGPFVQVSLPELARNQHDRTAFVARTTDLMHLSSLLAFPSFAGLAAAADDLVALAGDEWGPAARPLQLLCIAGAFRSLSFYGPPVLQALGRTRLLAAIAWTQTVLKTTAVILIARHLGDANIHDQLIGLAATMSVVEGFFLFGITIPILARTVGVRPATVVGNLTVPAAAGVGAVAVVPILTEIGPLGSLPALMALGLKGALGAGLALIVELLFDRRLRREVRQRLARRQQS